MQKQEEDLSFRDLFVPLTTKKSVFFIVFLGFITFFNMLFNNFLWDDIAYIVENYEIHTINFPLYFGPNIFNNNGQYRALNEVYFALVYALFNTHAFYYHLLQLVIHIATALLVFYFFKQFFKLSHAFFLSLIFLVHPMQVESVSYIAATGCILFLLTGMPVLILLEKKTLSHFQWIVIGVLLLSSLLIKESGLLVVIVSFAYAALFQKRWIKKITVAGAVSFFIYLAVRFGWGGIYYESRPLVPISRLTFPERMLNIPGVIFYYIKTFLFPVHIFIDQQWVHTNVTLRNFYLPFFLLSLIFIPLIIYTVHLLGRKHKGGKSFLFFLLWTIVGLGMYSQLLTLDRTVADRWFYFPIVGILGLIGCLLAYLPFFRNKAKHISIFFIVIISLLSLRTIIRNTNWKDGITLYAHDTRYYTNATIENDYASHLVMIGDYKNALVHQKKSVQLFPFEQNVLNLGRIYELLGERNNAKKYYQQAFKTKLYWAGAHKHIIHSYTHLAKILILEGNAKEAIPVIEAGLKDYKDDKMYASNPALWLLLAIAQSKAGDRKAAVSAAKNLHKALPEDKALYILYMRLLNHEEVDFTPYLNAILI